MASAIGMTRSSATYVHSMITISCMLASTVPPETYYSALRAWCNPELDARRILHTAAPSPLAEHRPPTNAPRNMPVKPKKMAMANITQGRGRGNRTAGLLGTHPQ